MQKATILIGVPNSDKMNPAWLLKNVRIKKKVDDVDDTKLVKVLEKIYHKLSITNSIELTTDEVDEIASFTIVASIENIDVKKCYIRYLPLGIVWSIKYKGRC